MLKYKNAAEKDKESPNDINVRTIINRRKTGERRRKTEWEGSATIILLSTKRIAFTVVFDAILFTSTDRMYTSQEYIIFIV